MSARGMTVPSVFGKTEAERPTYICRAAGKDREDAAEDLFPDAESQFVNASGFAGAAGVETEAEAGGAAAGGAAGAVTASSGSGVLLNNESS
ncbi:MAG: hypothetical protein AB7H77_02355 [Bdellovibrionales bacterium]